MNIKTLIATPILAAAALAQPTVAPTPEPVGAPRGDNVSDYNIVDSFETGYRFRTFGGSFDQYRSTVNYGNGVRLLSSFLTVNSKEGHGKYFDEIVLVTQGLGNDPYESATLRIQKNKLYRYDMNWRLNDYFNPGLRTDGAAGQHLLDTQYTTQDHELTLFPQSNFSFSFGYTRGNQNGPALSSIQLFDSTGNDFPLFENVRRLRNEYHLGQNVKFFGVRLDVTEGWENFKEDSTFLSGPNQGLVSGNVNSLTSFQRSAPYHGESPYVRVGLFTERKFFAVNGRFTYTAGRRAFIEDESSTGLGRFGVGIAREVVTSGNAQRPAFTANLTFSIFPTSKLTITNQTTGNNIRIDGNSTFTQLDNATQTLTYLAFQFFGIRTIANETSFTLQGWRWFGLFGGYQYSNREIRSIDYTKTNGNVFSTPSTQENALNSGMFGVRLHPVKPLSIVLNGEIGRADHPLSPIADRNYHVFGGRIQYKAKNYTLAAFTRENYNTNSVALSSYASHARNHGVSASWTPRDWFSLDAGYSKLHLNTAGGIAYFANATFITGEQSLYISNLHTANLTAHFDIRKRVDLFAGYSHIEDTGDGRSTASLGSVIILVPLRGPQTGSAPPGSALPAFQAAQTFPLRFLSPMARASVRITEKIRWNVGYQYYGYNENFYNGLDYRAHTGYTSLLWSF